LALAITSDSLVVISAVSLSPLIAESGNLESNKHKRKHNETGWAFWSF